MFKSQRMVKVVLAGPKHYLKSVTNKLYDLNFFHIVEHRKKDEEDFFDIGSPLEENENLSDMLVKIRSLISFLKITGNPKKSEPSLNEIEKTTKTVYNQIKSIKKSLAYVQKITKVHESEEQIKSLEMIDLELKEDLDYGKFNHYIGFVKEDIEEKVQDVTAKYELFTNKYKDLNLIVLFVDKKKDEKIIAILEDSEFSPIESPYVKTHYGDLKSDSTIKFVKLGKELEDLKRKEEKLVKKTEGIKKEYGKSLLTAEKVLSERVDVTEAPLKFATTKNTFVITGWAPEKKVSKLKKEVDLVADESIYIHTEKPKKDDPVPVALQNNKYASPFEFFMRLYTLPSYKEIDPTFFLALTFPFFFGMMLGDVGYGIITFFLFSWLKKKMPKAFVLKAFMVASISTIIFGVIFGEYMGLEHFPNAMNKVGYTVCEVYKMCEFDKAAGMYRVPHLILRSHQIEDMMSLSLLLGMVHIIIGLAIGFLNVKNAHGLKLAIFEKVGWLLLMPMMVWLLKDFLGVINGFVGDMLASIMPSNTVVFALFGIGGLLVVLGEGIRGAIEVLFMALLSNILSYARLMAVGLASLGLAVVVNDMAGEMFSSGSPCSWTYNKYNAWYTKSVPTLNKVTLC